MNVYIHLERFRAHVPIYHVAVSYSCGPFKKRYDFHPRRSIININGEKRTVFVGKCKRNPFEIVQYEQNMDQNYSLFTHDCRHYTQELLNYSLDDKLDITNVLSVHNLFENLNV